MGSITLRAGEPSPIPAAVTLDGDSGDDMLIGGDGRDVLYGGWGDDDLYGREGRMAQNGHGKA